MKTLGRIVLSHTYNNIISVENLLEAWREFVRGKRARKDVQLFQSDLMSNVLALHAELASKTYRHSPYEAFNISDPKPRNIHKAAVRDRLLHHAIYRHLYPFFDKTHAVRVLLSETRLAQERKTSSALCIPLSRRQEYDAAAKVLSKNG
jgi:hypothetical protein